MTADTLTADTDVEIPATEDEKPKRTPKAKVKTACACSQFAIKLNAETARAIGCTATTGGKFAPGHDAKLKSLLIEAGAKDLPVLRTVDGEDVEMSAFDAADLHGFASHVAKGAASAKEKAASAADRKAAREAKKVEREAIREAKKVEREAAKAAAAQDAETDADAS
jgi:hypothetical protein